MKYTLREEKAGNHSLLRYGEFVERARNTELEFWFEIERLRGLIKDLRKVLNVSSCCCEDLHHEKHEYHKGSDCPVENWVKDVLRRTGNDERRT